MLETNRKLVFVGGLHRSGTSVISRTIAEHPDVSAFADTGVPEDEGQHLQSVYPPAHEHGGPGRFGFDAAAHMTEESPLATEDNARRLFEEWSGYWDLGRDVLLEKSPPNLIRMRFLQHLFPGARFIVVMRHPVPVAFATRKWSKTSIPSLIRHWTLCHRIYGRDRTHIERLLEVRYEDFVADAAGTLDRIYEFLDVRPRSQDAQIRAGLNERYFSKWSAFTATLPGRMICWTLRARYARQIRDFGYSL